MGRGNWFPGNDLDDCEVCYLDYSDDSIDYDDYDLHQWRWDDCKQSILDCLPESFIRVDSLRDLPNYCQTVRDRDSIPLAFNSLYTIWIDSQGESYHQGIGITVNENAPGFAKANMGKMWSRFVDRLADHYEISLRSCAWTSHKYTKLTTAKG
jgi:hypothetical protein